ncbi:U1 small nuclear ribonucleoprotein A, putative [Plasmodium gallinaceum]|uniref:U1 small nuclear ribonucleoprotein A, putative n=1 Tax=Plasmodium gallinaceum TaxID=5849 RepID=A0A1J1GYZ4_PLAGA|nr:U1 small nuclear ribonucleoprotein A, putative [Plasmodium gallinaceum]CRG97457.1 U1 small nuclear ribonucleoprotein A, putative [Plasmodium gallinaceum]
MKNNNSFNDINRGNIHAGYNDNNPHYRNFVPNNNNFNNSKPNKDKQNQMNNTENIEKMQNSNYNINKQNKINIFNKNYINPHQNNNMNTNAINHVPNNNFHQINNLQINNITTNYTPENYINTNIHNNENFNSKDINKINSLNTNDSSNINNTTNPNSSINTNSTALMNNGNYSNTTSNVDNIANTNTNINPINNMNLSNNVNYNMNANYNMQNKLTGNTKPMYNHYPINMYQNSDSLNNPMRMHMYQQPNMIYNPMNYMNSKAYLKHLKYNKVITADPNIKPNETLYVKNLNDRIKPEEMKKNLKDLFKQYGIIKDIIVMKSFWRKGQAWIIYDTIESSTKALNAMQGYFLYGKIMQINYSHNKSDIHSKRDGTFVERSKNPKKPKQIIEREKKQKEIFETMHKNYLEMQMNNFKMSQNKEYEKKGEKIDLNQIDKQTLIAKAQAKAYEEKTKKNEDLSKNNIFPPYYPINTCSSIPNNVIVPYKILFVENVVENVNTQAFNDLFKSFAGFIEARIIPQRNVAFVDFSDEGTATYAMKVLQNYELQGSKLKISYAKR